VTTVVLRDSVDPRFRPLAPLPIELSTEDSANATRSVLTEATEVRGLSVFMDRSN